MAVGAVAGSSCSIRRTAPPFAGAAARGQAAAFDRTGDAEVDDPSAAVVTDQHVARLEVAMDDPRGVRSGEAARRLDEDLDDFTDAARSRREPRAEVRAAHELLREVDPVAVGADVVNRDDVRVRDAGDRLRLALEAREHLRLREVGADELERDLAVELWVIRGPHDAHAASSERLEQRESADRDAGLELVRSPASPWRRDRCIQLGRTRRAERELRDQPRACFAAIEVTLELAPLAVVDRAIDESAQRVRIRALAGRKPRATCASGCRLS